MAKCLEDSLDNICILRPKYFLCCCLTEVQASGQSEDMWGLIPGFVSQMFNVSIQTALLLLKHLYLCKHAHILPRVLRALSPVPGTNLVRL